MAKESKNNTKFENPSPALISEMLKAIDDLDTVIVHNDLKDIIKHFKSFNSDFNVFIGQLNRIIIGINSYNNNSLNLSNSIKSFNKNVRYIQGIFQNFDSLITHIKQSSAIKQVMVAFVDSLTYTENYINNNLTDFEGAEQISEILNSYFGIFNLDISSFENEFQNVKGINKKMADMITDIMTDLYYIGMIATSNESKVKQGMDALMGDNTDAYIALLKNDYNSQVSNNDSILYKYFLLNEVLSRVTTTKLSKMGWFKKIIFFNFTVKDTINRIINTMQYFYKQTDKLHGVIDEGDELIEKVTSDAMMSFDQFRRFVDILGDSKYFGVKKIIRVKLNILYLINTYRFILKQLVKLADFYGKYVKKSSRKGLFGTKLFKREERVVSITLLEPVEDVVRSLFDAVQTLEAVTRLSWWDINFVVKKRLKKMLSSLMQIPILINETLSNKNISIDLSTGLLRDLNDFIESVIKLSENLSVIEFGKTQKKGLDQFLDYIIGKPKSKNHGIIGRISGINKKQIDSAEAKLIQINQMFKLLLGSMKMAQKISSITFALIILNTIVIPQLYITIKKISKMNIDDKSIENANKLHNLIGIINKTVIEMIVIFSVMWLDIAKMVVSVTGAMIALNELVVGFRVLVWQIEKNKLTEEKVKNTNAILGQIAAFISGFALLVTKFVAWGSLLIMAVAIPIIVVGLGIFVMGFISISKKLEKKKVTIETGEKVLTGISGALAAFAASMKLLTSTQSGQAIDPKTYLAVLLIATVVFEIVGIMYMLQKMKLTAKQGAKTLLLLALALASFVGIMALVSLVAIPLAIPAMLTLALISAIIFGVAYICSYVGKNWGKILVGIILTQAMIINFVIIAYEITLIYAIISNIYNWKAFGFLFANVGAMIATTMLIGLLLIQFPMGIPAVLAGVAAMIIVAWSFAQIGVQLGICYEAIKGLSDWKSFGFLFANVGAMVLASALLAIPGLIGLIGIGAIVKIASDFTIIGKSIAECYETISKIDKWDSFDNLFTTTSEMIKQSAKLTIKGLIGRIGIGAIVKTISDFEEIGRAIAKYYESISNIDDWDTIINSFNSIKTTIQCIADLSKNNSLISMMTSNMKLDLIQQVIDDVKSIGKSLFDLYIVVVKIINWKIFEKFFNNIRVGIIDNIKLISEELDKNRIRFLKISIDIELIKNAIEKIQVIGESLAGLYTNISKIKKWEVFESFFTNLKNIISQFDTFSNIITPAQLIKVQYICDNVKSITEKIYSTTQSVDVVSMINKTIIWKQLNRLMNVMEKFLLKPGEIMKEIGDWNVFDTFFENISKVFDQISEMNLSADVSIQRIKTLRKTFRILNQASDHIMECYQNAMQIQDWTVFDNFTNGISKILTSIADQKIKYGALNKNIGEYKKIANLLNKLSNAEFNNIDNYEKGVNKAIEFTNTISNAKLENLQTATNMFQKMSDFSRSINGNFEGLADTINEKIMPLLEKLNETLGKTNDNIESGKFNASSTPTATGSTSPTGVPAVTTPGQPGQQGQQQRPQRDYSSVIGELKTELQKISKTLVDGTQIVVVDR